MVRAATLAAILSVLLAIPRPAGAQDEGPQPCAQTAATADYGAVRVGSVVVPQRHRFVGGDPNWDPRMARYLGRPARVVRLSGVDDRGCPGVRVSVDRGRWFWRVRDLNVGAETPTPFALRRAPAPLPQRCGHSDASAEFGPLDVGVAVVLGRHRPVRDDANFSEGMAALVGRVARIEALTGVDDRGCAVVHVDLDGRQHYWRVRDLLLAEAGSEGFRPGIASDHGRGEDPEAVDPEVDLRVPQECGRTDETVTYGPLVVGAAVQVGRHRAVDGQYNWSEEMDAYVGLEATVTEHVGVDEQGCALVLLDLDEGGWLWRARDLRLP